MTPWSITMLNAASTLGETSFPYAIGISFDWKLFWSLAVLMSVSMAVALAVSVAAWRQSVRVVCRRQLDVNELNELFEF